MSRAGRGGSMTTEWCHMGGGENEDIERAVLECLGRPIELSGRGGGVRKVMLRYRSEIGPVAVGGTLTFASASSESYQPELTFSFMEGKTLTIPWRRWMDIPRSNFHLRPGSSLNISWKFIVLLFLYHYRFRGGQWHGCPGGGVDHYWDSTVDVVFIEGASLFDGGGLGLEDGGRGGG